MYKNLYVCICIKYMYKIYTYTCASHINYVITRDLHAYRHNYIYGCVLQRGGHLLCSP